MNVLFRLATVTVLLWAVMPARGAESDLIGRLQAQLKPAGGYGPGGAADAWRVVERARALKGQSPWDDGGSAGNAKEAKILRDALMRRAEKDGPRIYLWILQNWPEDDYVKQAAVQGLVYGQSYTIRDLDVLVQAMEAVNYQPKYINMDTPTWLVPGYAVAKLGQKIDAVLYPEIGGKSDRPSPIKGIKSWLVLTMELAMAHCTNTERRKILADCLHRLQPAK